MWAINEPFAAAGAGEYWPVFHVLRGLNRGRGKTWVDLQVSNPELAVVAWRDGPHVQVWLANLGDREQHFTLTGLQVTGQALLDAERMSAALDTADFLERREAATDGLNTLPAYAVRVLDCQAGVEYSR